jgi:hypothetical protein
MRCWSLAVNQSDKPSNLTSPNRTAAVQLEVLQLCVGSVLRSFKLADLSLANPDLQNSDGLELLPYKRLTISIMLKVCSSFRESHRS